MPTPVALVILLAYASLAVELTWLHVPSVASSRNLWLRPPELVAGYSRAYGAVFAWPWLKKTVLLTLPLIAAYGVYVYPLVALWGPYDPLGDHAFRTGPFSAALAVTLIVAGRVITLASVVSIRGATPTLTSPLHTSGPFRYSRNPGLVGMYLFVAGLWLAAPSSIMLAGIAIYIGHMHFKVRMEENFLENRFGEPYLDYCRRTSRYWP
jgi:protein-S-isoprenylcysteine O-methyltransferase Ste14